MYPNLHRCARETLRFRYTRRVLLGLMFVLSGGCSSTDTGGGILHSAAAGDYTIDVTLRSESNECLPPSAMVRFAVYGYDRFVADVPATLIREAEVHVMAPGEPYRLSFSEAELGEVEYQSGGETSLQYYFIVEVDRNGDGSICAGDLQRDYDRSEFLSYSSDQRAVAVEVSMKPVTDASCN